MFNQYTELSPEVKVFSALWVQQEQKFQTQKKIPMFRKI